VIDKQKSGSLFTTIFDAVSLLANSNKNTKLQLANLERWGIKYEKLNIIINPYPNPQTRELLSIEPYTFVTALIEECLKLINKIADATDFSGVLHVDPPPLSSKPQIGEPGYDYLVGKTAQRVAVLGQ
jgi:hypothetical protein